ncbi:telomeric repeat binding factor a [Melanotaenia boesemani]|uniref:telomeric repeat binding factor a n=1 Tax=Melanotaenia boesemani TaxID=1250792 RepID=UPI001C0597D8|nr:telomeric repeat binding factor a [Melanotaenia boesemani]
MAKVLTNICCGESVVNRWVVDFYCSLALEFFKNDKYKDFCAITTVLDSVLIRPLESTSDMSLKIRLLQLLSRVNEGEKPEMQFEADNVVSPLESALILLENMIKEFGWTAGYQNVHISLKEMAVGILIMKNKFDQAKEVLNKYFPKDAGGKRAVFMDLIRKESQEHEVIKQMNFHQFKEVMLNFCIKLCKFSEPFLYKAAEKLVSTRLMVTDDQEAHAATVDECEEPGPSSTPQMVTVHVRPCKHALIQRARLAAAFNDMDASKDEKSFAQLEEEVEAESQEMEDISSQHSTDHDSGDNLNSEKDGLYHRDSCSHMEASPVDQPPQTDAGTQSKADFILKVPYTVARLVVEPDSQPSSHCITAPEESETEVRTEKPPQKKAASSKKYIKDMECPVTEKEVSIPIRKHPKQTSSVTRASASVAECSTDSEDVSGDSAANRKNDDALSNQSNGSLSGILNKSRQMSSESEENTQKLLPPCQTPVQRHRKQPSRSPTSNDPGDADDMHITDCSSDHLPRLSPQHSAPQKSSTPHKDSTHDKGLPKFMSLFNNVTESKATWDDEDSYFPTKSTGSNESSLSNSGNRKRRWTESETQKLKEGVKKFGEGNWRKIKAYYSFKDRTNVNLKDRWRTMKKLNMV